MDLNKCMCWPVDEDCPVTDKRVLTKQFPVDTTDQKKEALQALQQQLMELEQELTNAAQNVTRRALAAAKAPEGKVK